MEKLQSPRGLFNLHFYHLLLHLLQFSCFQLLSSAYTVPDKYFINCGSDSSATVNNRIFVGDSRPVSFSLSATDVISVKSDNPSSVSSPLYQTARIFRSPAFYEFRISDSITHLVRLHFFPFASQYDLAAAVFDVSVSEYAFPLLYQFRVQNSSSKPVLKEYLLHINSTNFTIHFTPSGGSPLSFVNAIEVFPTPKNFIPNDATHVNHGGSKPLYVGLSSQIFETVYRINVGGPVITPQNDTLWRSWNPDQSFLLLPDAAKPVNRTETPKYQDGKSSKYIAPVNVYNTAQEMNIRNDRLANNFNITWRFDVNNSVSHLVRLHFYDLLRVSNENLVFNLYIYQNYSQEIDNSEASAPHYKDFVVDSDDSGTMIISVGPNLNSQTRTAYLNGLEIMEMKNSRVYPDTQRVKKKKHVFLVVGSVLGGVAFTCMLILLFWLLKSRKLKRQQAPISAYGGSLYDTICTSDSQVNLGLKIPFADIQLATHNFDDNLLVGKGGFGKVYKGILFGRMKVAVKRGETGSGQGRPEFQTEIMVLSKIRHRHLVSLIGYYDERAEMILVYEFMEKGTLRNHLYGSDLPSLSWKQRLEICIGSARGLHYLHTGTSRAIIHRDIKSTNILLDENYVAKVADFGLSKSGPLGESPVNTGVKGTFGYLDPEYFRCQQLTDKSDVYSFGVVLLEVLCTRPAIDSLLPMEQVNLAEWGIFCLKKGLIEEVMDPFLVGKISPSSLRKFVEAVEKCLREYGADRPSMGDVLWDLEYALQLQVTAQRREPHEDSTNCPASEFSLRTVQRVPSVSMEIERDDIPLTRDDDSNTTAIQIFSQLEIDEGR